MGGISLRSLPTPMETNAIFFGGTDPGRFVPTYMIYSAKVRPDIYLITQNALADNTYMNVMRDLYGDQIWIPTPATPTKPSKNMSKTSNPAASKPAQISPPKAAASKFKALQASCRSMPYSAVKFLTTTNRSPKPKPHPPPAPSAPPSFPTPPPNPTKPAPST